MKETDEAKYSLDQLLDKAEELVDQYNYELGQKFCQRALEMNPDASDVRLDLAAAYEKTGANRDAIAALEERLRRAPGSADAEADLGFALVRLGRRDQAVAHFERALKLRGEEGGTAGEALPGQASWMVRGFNDAIVTSAGQRLPSLVLRDGGR